MCVTQNGLCRTPKWIELDIVLVSSWYYEKANQTVCYIMKRSFGTLTMFNYFLEDPNEGRLFPSADGKRRKSVRSKEKLHNIACKLKRHGIKGGTTKSQQTERIEKSSSVVERLENKHDLARFGTTFAILAPEYHIFRTSNYDHPNELDTKIINQPRDLDVENYTNEELTALLETVVNNALQGDSSTSITKTPEIYLCIEGNDTDIESTLESSESPPPYLGECEKYTL
ncbi:uncharacterized protein KNAG_0H01340 [Huiozyma naganishii CBS 8797]|uniref:Uncharacterized protein n=1 Tax=Huiozyma naganishii (strain ATCC MYA-139 / BCRC 22969 / CBS 8797 / KCTC 17520 / NBRC 10181 / NCYC 3082 / Yp74L-3) TaxID=1071383 RepID=J7S1P1_HUIN7|nr:hypothetical protein KNAG_0H01340 [Kazachstania naganishii CBS 8797]CCK71547.1 hypothetical protein KNAG_0H01340 [Kazachstania naganishii CBS 8797]